MDIHAVDKDLHQTVTSLVDENSFEDALKELIAVCQAKETHYRRVGREYDAEVWRDRFNELTRAEGNL